MANISVTYTFSNGSTADATEVNTNFTDIINGTSDGTKDFSISALTCAGTATLNGAVNLGNSTSDDITITGRIASDIDPKTAASNTLGDATQTWQALYIDNTTTDGGAIYFGGGSTEYIKASADGTNLEFGGFTSLLVPDGSPAAPSIYSSTGTSDTGISMGTADQVHISTAGVENVEFGSSEVVFNDTQANIDFRVEGDGDAHLIFADASEDRVGIGTSTPASPYKLSVDGGRILCNDSVGSNVQVIVQEAGTQGITIGIKSVSAAPTGFMYLRAQDANAVYMFIDNSDVLRLGTFAQIGTAAGTIVGTQTSDERLKTNIRDLDIGLKEVLGLRPIRYTLEGKEEIGFGAQTTMASIPEAVYNTEAPLDNDDPDTTSDKLAMDYVRIIPALVSAIKELDSRLKLVEG